MSNIAIPKIIHHIWLGPAAMHPDMVTWREGWAQLHPGWVMKLWRDHPDGSLACGEERLAPRYPELLAKCCHLVQRSNIWRVEVMHAQGGLYLDTDMEPIRNVEPILEGRDAVAAQHFFGVGTCGFAFVAAIPGHPWLAEALARLPEEDPARTYSMGDLFIDKIRQNHPEVHLLPRETIMSMWRPRGDLVRGIQARPETYAVHRWSSRWYPVGYEPLAESAG